MTPEQPTTETAALMTALRVRLSKPTRCGCGGEYAGHDSCADRALLEQAASALAAAADRETRLRETLTEALRIATASLLAVAMEPNPPRRALRQIRDLLNAALRPDAPAQVMAETRSATEPPAEGTATAAQEAEHVPVSVLRAIRDQMVHEAVTRKPGNEARELLRRFIADLDRLLDGETEP